MQMKTYDNLKQATPMELLEAACWFYADDPEMVRWIKFGFSLSRTDGWKQVAPHWLEQVKKKS